MSLRRKTTKQISFVVKCFIIIILTASRQSDRMMSRRRGQNALPFRLSNSMSNDQLDAHQLWTVFSNKQKSIVSVFLLAKIGKETTTVYFGIPYQRSYGENPQRRRRICGGEIEEIVRRDWGTRGKLKRGGEPQSYTTKNNYSHILIIQI